MRIDERDRTLDEPERDPSELDPPEYDDLPCGESGCICVCHEGHVCACDCQRCDECQQHTEYCQCDEEQEWDR